ncbi:MAG: hypothetical protein CMN29_10030 [Sandaracinus sp.]|nr:hypothetical protein [Sandaracinus sp.]
MLRRLGRGGMAEVFEAVATGADGFERRVALKRVLPDKAADARFRAMFFDEARLASRLHHANVVAVLDYGLEGERPFQVLELVDGADLGALLDERGPLPLGLALHVGREVALALDHAHRAKGADGAPLGLVHRDVSPSNVLVSREGEVKLTDFGIAFAHGRRTETAAGTVKGKAAYMSPEQLMGAPLDGRSDLFALACLVHAAATGASPLAGEDRMARLLAGAPLPLDPSLPEDVRALLGRGLRLARSERFGDAAELAEALAGATRRHLEGDGRLALRALFDAPPAPASPLDALFDLSALPGGGPGEVPRFERTRATGAGGAPGDEEAPAKTTAAGAGAPGARFGATPDRSTPDRSTPDRATPDRAAGEEVAGDASSGDASSGDASSGDAPSGDGAAEPPPRTRLGWRFGLGALAFAGALGGAAFLMARPPDASPRSAPAARSTDTPASPPSAGRGPELRASPGASAEASERENLGAVAASAPAASASAASASAASERGPVDRSEPAPSEAREPTSGERDEAPGQATRAARAAQRAAPRPGAAPPAPDETAATLATLRVGGAGALRARVRVDGRDRGYAPLALELPVGRHRVELVAEDGTRHQRSLVLTERHTPRAPARWILP